MRLMPWNNDDLHRYSRAASRAYPQLLWWQVGLKTWETLLAAPEVIAHRTTRLMTAGLVPGASDRREFVDMGTEKVVAFSRAWVDASGEILAFQHELARLAGRQWSALLTAFNPFLAGPSAQAFLSSFDFLTSVLAAGNHTMTALPRVAHSAVRPVHARATRNARRLRRRT